MPAPQPPTLVISRPGTPSIEQLFAGGAQGLPQSAPKDQPWKCWVVDPTKNDSEEKVVVDVKGHDWGSNGLGGY
jgi:hypothetical protein